MTTNNSHSPDPDVTLDELQEKLDRVRGLLTSTITDKHVLQKAVTSKDLQIAELKKKLRLAYTMGIESTYSPAKGRSRDRQIEKIIKSVDLPQD